MQTPTGMAESYASDLALLSAAASGDPDAVRTLLDQTGSVVFGFIYARVGGDEHVAEDLVQETFLEGMRSAHTYRAEAAVRTWLCTIARRRVARYYETERKAAVARAGLAAVDEGYEDPIERRDEIVRALGRLPALHRQVLVMKYLDELSVEEIAREMGRTHVQVQSMLQRARTGLRRELEPSRD